MKPIQLTIAGLQSYRDKQTIDFTKLCDAGVFGIFGPTGSGKSTILDAMTLALYGEVERASGGTQGILNHAENTLSVSFTFELSSPSGRERYRVDRQYKRSGETSLLQTVSRFVQLGTGLTANGESVDVEGSAVLADKSKEVTRMVQETLGLSMHDFTRAVVLPQGKFAEFLSLKDSERRQMLQRLFALEAYGNQLNGKLSGRVKASESALKQIAAEQQGLGDASEEALKAAITRLHEAKRAAKQQRERLHASQTRRDELKQRWDWQQERDKLGLELDKLASQEGAIADWERSLLLAEAADRLMQFLREREETARLSEAAGREQVAAAEALAAATSGHSAAVAAHAAAQQALLAGEAGLSVRLERLRQALALQQELQRLAAELAQLNAAREQTAGAHAASTARLQQQAELRERAQLKQAELQQQLKRLEVPAGDRHKLQAAALDKQQLASAALQAAELAAEAARSAQALERLQQQRRELAARDAALGAQLAADAAGAAAEREALRELAREASRLQAAAASELARQQRQRRERETARLSALLAATLAEGEPCPVCGSHEHPRLSAEHEHAPASAALLLQDEQADAAIEQLEQLREPLQQLQFKQYQQAEKLDELAARWAVDTSNSTAHNAESYAEAAAAHATVIDPPIDLSAEADSVASSTSTGGSSFITIPIITEAVAKLDDRTAAAMKRVGRIEEAFKLQQQQQRQLELLHNELTARMETAQAASANAADKQQAHQSHIGQLQTAWSERYDGKSVEQIEQELSLLHDQDRQAEELRERLAKSVPFLENTTKLMDDLHKESVQLERELVQLHAQCDARTHAAEEKGMQLREWMEDGDDIAKKMSDTQSQLQTIRVNEQSARQQVSELQSSLQQCIERQSTAAQAKRSAHEAAAKADRYWQEAISSTIFTSQQEVEEARLPEQERSSRQSSIRLHREQEQKCKLKVQTLDEQLQGLVITEEQWNECLAEWLSAKEQDEAALQETAKAERDLEDVETKHVKWSQLQGRRTELEVLLGRLAKLQSVLRGNAFVEYVAEEQLTVVSRAASQRLGDLTGQRYAIEVDSTGGFLIRDDANGGVKRPVSTLSGGETFLASLALALALSAQIQLRGRYPLEFFFLDEGFGTLDQELLESVIASLEKLYMERLTVGVISHVPELRARLPRRLIVQPADAEGGGSRVTVESG